MTKADLSPLKVCFFALSVSCGFLLWAAAERELKGRLKGTLKGKLTADLPGTSKAEILFSLFLTPLKRLRMAGAVSTA